MKPEITIEDIKLEYRRRRENKVDYVSFEGYVPHKEVIRRTGDYRQVCMMAANRCGKSELGGYIVACHLMGEYPDWWDGKRFLKGVNILVAGETGALVRDSVQEKLLGSPNERGMGFLRKDSILDTRSRAGIPNAIDTVYVRHSSGDISTLQFQSYDQGREKFQATARDMVWCDEEPPLEVYLEILMRTMTTGGFVLSTFTPLKGVSNTVLYLKKQEEEDNAKVITATWDDAPHLTEAAKEELFKSLPPHQRDARSKGVPSLGSGAVYPVNESDFVVGAFEIPKHYRFVYGLDVGWNNTAAVWGAIDPDTDVIYIYSEYKRGQAEPAIHAATIRGRGEMHGVIDPASRGRTQSDGEQLIWLYRQQGLHLTPADNGVESGIFEVYERLTTGRLKVFDTCKLFLEEYRLYRRDQKGKVVKENDHLMDALRYLVKSGVPLADSKMNKYSSVSMRIRKSVGSYMGV